MIIRKPNIIELLNSMWSISSNDPNDDFRFVVTLDTYHKSILNQMIADKYFIGELDRQFHKSEMCLMYAVYTAMSECDNIICLKYRDAYTKKMMWDRLYNRINNIMIVKSSTKDRIEFWTGSVIEFNLSSSTTHLIIDEAAYFPGDVLKNILENTPDFCEIKILTSEYKENEVYENLTKEKKYTYFRHRIQG